MVLSFALGLGVLFLSLYTQYASETVGVLFGSILSVSRSDVLVTLYSGLGNAGRDGFFVPALTLCLD